MADGTLDLLLDEPHAVADTRPLIADNIACGGGASTGIEMALGRSPDAAINHDEVALAMHESNQSNIWQVDPHDVVPKGQRVGLAWFSPDCKHHSKAKCGKPVERNIRAEWVRPEVIMLENVEEFQDWCPQQA